MILSFPRQRFQTVVSHSREFCLLVKSHPADLNFLSNRLGQPLHWAGSSRVAPASLDVRASAPILLRRERLRLELYAPRVGATPRWHVSELSLPRLDADARASAARPPECGSLPLPVVTGGF